MVLNEAVKNTVFSVVGFEFSGKITAKENCDGVYVSYDGENAVIGFTTKAQEARCYFLLSMEIKNGKKSFEIEEKPMFDVCGPMIDMSRGGVMRVDAVKKYIDAIAALGMNMLMLYTEDIYEVEGYPMFGYLRGRYSLEELRAIDDHADSLGVEVIPCIQTLGHLAQYIKWKEGAEISDNATVLLVGDERTYQFIEAEISTVRKAFRSDRIHLGMDEARNLGRGKYLEKNGYHEETEVFYSHLNRVLEIARKYYKEPMIWSDMLFQTGDGRYYLPEMVVPQETVDNAPEDVTLVFWDYYNDTYDFYNKNLIQHNRFKNKIAFAGGVWTWDGFAPNFTYTLETMKPAMQSCIDRGVRTVIATKWGNDGCESDFAKAVAGLAVFSEYCYKGRDCTDDDIYAAAYHISGINKELSEAISDFYIGLPGAVRFGKGVFYVDPLINMMHCDADMNEAAKIFRRSLDVINKNSDYKFSKFYALLFEIVATKAEVLAKLQDAYKNDDRDYLKKTADETFPALEALYAQFYGMFKGYWRADYKPFGFEAYAQRFGGVMMRLSDASEIIHDYLDGKTDRIEELEQEVIKGINKSWRGASNYMVTY